MFIIYEFRNASQSVAKFCLSVNFCFNMVMAQGPEACGPSTLVLVSCVCVCICVCVYICVFVSVFVCSCLSLFICCHKMIYRAFLFFFLCLLLPYHFSSSFDSFLPPYYLYGIPWYLTFLHLHILPSCI